MRRALLGLIGCCMLPLSGCAAKTATVSGTVTLDGKAVADGYIAFVPQGAGQGGGSKITNGAYKITAPVGKYRVEITASKLITLPPGQVGMNGEKEEVRQYIPENYNTETELQADLPSAGSVDFTLRSK